MEITIDKFGRVLIPKKLRDQLALEEGASLSAEVDNGVIILKPEQTSVLVNKGGVLVFCGEPETALKDAVKNDRFRRTRKAGKLRGR